VIGIAVRATLDVSKVVALMAVNDGDVIEYVWDHPQVRRIVNELPYFVALPTTSGTGSEVGRSSVVSEDAAAGGAHVNRVVFWPKLVAKPVFPDPELTLGLPPAVTAATGIDALTHNVESYLSPAYHPLCDGIALEGVRIAARALPTAVRNGDDLQARSDMMIASMMGAIAFQKDLGAVHSCAHALGAVCDLHHGLANALMLEPVMRFNLESARAKFAELAHVAGTGGPEDFVPWLARLKREIGSAPSLAAVGVKREQIPALVAIAERDTCHQTNPRPVVRADFERFFEQAF
jgi:alcohol dehydrogenase class IV